MPGVVQKYCDDFVFYLRLKLQLWAIKEVRDKCSAQDWAGVVVAPGAGPAGAHAGDDADEEEDGTDDS